MPKGDSLDVKDNSWTTVEVLSGIGVPQTASHSGWGGLETAPEAKGEESAAEANKG